MRRAGNQGLRDGIFKESTQSQYLNLSNRLAFRREKISLMDLPTCPHCGESVLDDDVDECPFCGESMSSKPTGKKPAKSQPKSAPAEPAPTKAETKTATKKTPKKPKPKPEKAAASDDEPFAVDQAAMSNAVPLRPKPVKGRTYEVVCPMCETAGYTSPKAGGREVKCANPKCLVPIFTCPEPPPAPVEEPPREPEGLSTTQLGLISAVALVAIGAGIWFFVLKDDSEVPSPNPGGQGVVENENTKTSKTENGEPVNNQKTSDPPKPQGPNLVKLRQEAPAIMIETSKWPSGRTIKRPKPLRIQGIALAYADLGELKKAEEQLDRLANYNDDSPHYRVLPWVEIGWKLREREQSASGAADNALKFAQDIPKSNHESWMESVSVAALLAALGRENEALPLFERNFGQAADQELWADMMAVSLDHTFDIDAIESVRPLVTPQSPAWSSVVWQLVFHDAITEGLNWAKRHSQEPIRSEALIAWGDAVVARSLALKQPADFAALDSAIQELPKPWSEITTARAYSGMGQRYAVAGDQKTADTLLKKAEAALEKLPQKTAMPEPDLRTIYDGNFPKTRFNTQMATSAFEVARLQAQLNLKDEAWTSIERGLEVLRSESLPESTASRLATQVKSKFESDILKGQLKSELSLDSEEKARQALRSYQTHVNNLKDEADVRLTFQASLLSKATEWGLVEQAAKEILNVPTNRPQDSYLKTVLPWIVYTKLPKKDSQQTEALAAILQKQRGSKPKKQTLLENAQLWMKQGKFTNVVDALGTTSVLPASARKRWLLRLFTQQVKAGNTDAILTSLLSLFNKDKFLAEDAATLIAAFATKQGQGNLVWRELESSSWSATQRIAAYRGFIEAATPLAEETPETPETE